eukprot:6977549-Prymnesium_polylepis.2
MSAHLLEPRRAPDVVVLRNHPRGVGVPEAAVERRVVVEIVLAQPVVDPVDERPVDRRPLADEQRERGEQLLHRRRRDKALVRKVAVDAAADADDEEDVVAGENAEPRHARHPGNARREQQRQHEQCRNERVLVPVERRRHRSPGEAATLPALEGAHRVGGELDPLLSRAQPRLLPVGPAVAVAVEAAQRGGPVVAGGGEVGAELVARVALEHIIRVLRRRRRDVAERVPLAAHDVVAVGHQVEVLRVAADQMRGRRGA